MAPRGRNRQSDEISNLVLDLHDELLDSYHARFDHTGLLPSFDTRHGGQPNHAGRGEGSTGPRAGDHGTAHADHHAETPDGDLLPHDYPAPHLGTVRGQSAGAGTPHGGSGGEVQGPAAAVIESGVVLTEVPTGGIGVAYGDTFRLHSLPTSNYKVFLDFDGHTTTGTSWNSYFGTSTFYSSAFSLDGSESFTSTELLRVQQIWQQIAEFFSPFNIDVTTEDPGLAGLTYSGTGDTAFGIRVVITDEGGKNYGGLGYVGSFDWNSDTPVFVYANPLGDSVKNIAVAAAHETGHSLGLSHDGQGTADYYYGHGSGATSWAPVMGVGYSTGVVQWSKGEYLSATQTQDDLAIITTQNSGVTYRADDHGNTFAAASALGGSVAGGVASVSTYGIITGSGTRNDIDMFSFSVAQGGSIDLRVSAASQINVTGGSTPLYAALPLSMLDVKLSLFDASYTLVAQWDDPTRIDGQVTLTNVAGGTYFLAVDGTGWGSPTASTPTGWTEYGSLGQYRVTGTYTAGGGGVTAPPPQLTASKTALSTTEGGGSDALTIRVLNPVADVTVNVGGLDATEGRLSASTLVLNAANNWTATLGVTGVNDRDVDGAVSYALGFSAAGLDPLTVTVTNADNDSAPISGGSATTTTTTSTKKGGAKATANAAAPASLLSDDGSTLTVTETGRSPNFTANWNWQFTGLSAGDYRVQLDASANGEAFRFQYSTDGAVTWRAFDGAPASATAWNGDFLATGVGSSLWVRLTDAMPTGDSVKSSFLVDLLTISQVPSADVVLL